MCSRHLSNNNYDKFERTFPKLRDRQLVMNVMRTVLEHYDDPKMTLERIAEEELLSKSHLSHIFKQVTGMLFSDYVRNIRINAACRLLRDTDMTNEQICYACGFTDVPSFYRFFQTHMNMTLSTYRKSINNNAY